MPIQKVAIIFDNQVRPDTTGGYCLRALGGLVEVTHFLPSQLEEIPRNGQEDLFRDGVHLATYRDAEEMVQSGTLQVS